MKLILVGVAISLIVLAINIPISVALRYSIFKNLGNLQLRMFGIRLINSDITVMAGYLNLTKRNKKVIKIKISLKDNNLQFVNDVMHSLQRKIYLQNISFQSVVGLQEANITSLVSGYINMCISLLYSMLCIRNMDAKYIKSINSQYCQKQLDFNVKFKVYVNLYDLMWSILTAIYKRRVRVYGKAKYRNNS